MTRHLHSIGRHGVHETPDAEGTSSLVEPGAVPTCPRCGITGHASRIGHPQGTYFCSCGQLYEGTDIEWRRWARRRREAATRRAGMKDEGDTA